MAKRQTVQVPLEGVLMVQDAVSNLENLIADPGYAHDQKNLWRNRLDGFKYAIQHLELPIQWKGN